MTVLILAFPAETRQQTADRVLADWQSQRRAGVKPEDRQIADDAFHREIEVLRQLLERTR